MIKNIKRAQVQSQVVSKKLTEVMKPTKNLQRSFDFQQYKYFSTLMGKSGEFKLVGKDSGYKPMNGNEAAAYVAYALSENSFIYPITPSSPMGEYMDTWKTYGRKNIWDKIVAVDMMQSEAGAAGAVHGSIASGSLTTTFSCSQGLLLKVPNMFLISGELMPTVFHVAARSITKHALSIHGDHMDVMHARSTGFAQLSSTSVQEAMDMALIAHISTLKSRVPFIHFFDGFRTSHEISKIKPILYEQMKEVFPNDALQQNLRSFQLSPHTPIMRGTGQRPDCFFQASMASKPYYDKCPYIVQQVMNEIGDVIGRKYKLFEYYGHPEPESITIALGSSTQTIEETVDYLNNSNSKNRFGVLKIRLYRPWSMEHFIEAIPKTVKRIAVLDRTKEEGAIGEPLYLDVVATLNEMRQTISSGDRENIEICIGGIYGLSSKEFTPAMVKAVYENLNSSQPKKHFVVGIDDDVSHTSIPYGEEFDPNPQNEVTQCIFWGLGSDGTIGANQAAISSFANNTRLKVQGYFAYDAYKTDGTTNSHLRFGMKEIKSPYMIKSNASYIACHKDSYVKKFDMVNPLKDGGTFIINCKWSTLEELNQQLPKKMRKLLAQKNAKLYTIDASTIAQSVGLGKRINNIMQACFYKLSGVLPVDEAIAILKQDIIDLYSGKGQKIVDMNQKAVDQSFDHLIQIQYNKEEWANLSDKDEVELIKGNSELQSNFLNNIFKPILTWGGDNVPVSAFEAGGYMRSTGTTEFEKRGIALNIPIWKPDLCTQCNYCSIVCPHAVIRPFLLDREQVDNAPEGFQVRKAKGGAEMSGLNYTIQISTMDCTGCEVCVQSCPDSALVMKSSQEALPFIPHWDYAYNLPHKPNVLDRLSVKGSQFEQPLLEFSGACGGCGETPYVKLLTQLFGERMVIANATGCSMIWGSMYPSNPYTVRKESLRGPAYGHSLFEDNAEYGFGIVLANKNRKNALALDMEEFLPQLTGDPVKEKLKKSLENWLKHINNWKKCEKIHKEIREILPQFDQKELESNRFLKLLADNTNLITVNSYWMIGGDGWAYDIGYGGIDHVLSTKTNFNILVLDTEMYSNTGGQESKSTPTGASVKFDLGGKKMAKKDLGLQAITYGHVYVASISLGASFSQAVQALREAEEYNGPSLILSLTPCIDWGFTSNNQMMEIQKLAVECGYWPLYRYDPRRKDKKFQLDAKRIKVDVSEFLDKQMRFTKLKRDKPETAKKLQEELRQIIQKKMRNYQMMAMDDFELLESLKKQMGESVSGEKTLVLYGTESGNAQNLANQMGYELKRRGVRATIASMSDYDILELPFEKNVYVIVSTAGQGEFPLNAKSFWASLCNPELPKDLLKDVKFSVFGLGDTSYVYFNRAAELIDQRFQQLGAKKILRIGLGNDKDDERYETAWQEWTPNLFNEAGLDAPPDVLLPASFKVSSVSQVEDERYIPEGYSLIPATKNQLLTPEGYDRDIRHYEFDIEQLGWKYFVGDVLTIYPYNNTNEVSKILEDIGLNPEKGLHIEQISTDVKRVLPEEISYKRLFSEVFDIFGRPTRAFYDFLSIYCKDENQKKQLKHLISKEGEPDFKNLIKETVTCGDLFKMFPSAIPSIDYMVEYMPLIKPRLYSIASSYDMTQNIQLCIILNDWTTPKGKYRTGLCTKYLQGLRPNQDKILAKIQEGPCPHPESTKTPAILVALGTGMAPVRAFLQERAVAQKRGEQIGETYLIYGNRHKKTEYLYEEELSKYKQSGVLTEIFTAFSRDQEKKIYVQNRIEQNPDIVNDVLYKQKGYFYLCGQGGSVPEQVKKAIKECIKSKSGISEDEAENHITEMRIQGRYNLDVW